MVVFSSTFQTFFCLHLTLYSIFVSVWYFPPTLLSILLIYRCLSLLSSIPLCIHCSFLALFPYSLFLSFILYSSSISICSSFHSVIILPYISFLLWFLPSSRHCALGFPFSSNFCLLISYAFLQFPFLGFSFALYFFLDWNSILPTKCRVDFVWSARCNECHSITIKCQSAKQSANACLENNVVAAGHPYEERLKRLTPSLLEARLKKCIKVLQQVL